jgi:hypothetical protein
MEACIFARAISAHWRGGRDRVVAAEAPHGKKST